MFKKLLCLIIVALGFVSINGQVSDTALKAVIEKDRANRDAAGRLQVLSAAEHLTRGRIYLDNRHFPESREHFQRIIDNYSTDAAMGFALFGMGRSLMWERQYAAAIPYFDRVSSEFPGTKDGREGLYFLGSCHIRLRHQLDGAKFFEQYTVMYPTGERIDGSYLNLIDAYREAGKYDDATSWVDRTVSKYGDAGTAVNALHAKLRMEIYRGNWAEAEGTASRMLAINKFAGTMASSDETKFLMGFAVEKAGRKADAIRIYSSIPYSISSYYAGLATDKLVTSGNRVKRLAIVTPKMYVDFPTPFRSELLEFCKRKKIDPRFLLAIMKQESSFRPQAKSPSAARGLLQLVYDTALKYNKKAGFSTLQPDDLYQPRVNIAIGTEYIADLKQQFGGLYEAIAASYNGGEDNAQRWLDRSKPKDPAIFASEVGFAETKNYVFKVMTNYRIYRDLYDESLTKR